MTCENADHVGKLLEDATELSDGGLHIVQCFCSAIEVGVLLRNHEGLRLLLLRLSKQRLPANQIH